VELAAATEQEAAPTPLDDDPALDAIFREGGTLARALPGFRFRSQQLAMAQAIAHAIANRTQLVAEAGTGTGKTFAYLVPALLYGGKVIISTGTKTLQDQLFERDLPLVRDALAAPVTVALLKGRANYVCHYHLERAAREDRLPSRDDVRHLPKIIAFARAAERGDRAELGDVPENASIWPLVTSTRDNCLGQNCPHHSACFVMKARKEALEADVVVVNHHLFFADVMLRDEGVAELLPNCNTVILDEAHQLPDTATLFFGEQVTAGQLADLARDAEIAARTAARDVPDLPDAASDLVPAVRKLRLAAGEGVGKFAREMALGRAGFAEALDGLAAALDCLSTELGRFAERGEEIAQVAARADEVRASLKMWFAIDTLEFLKRGGRIGAASAWIGSTLKVKPILTVENEMTPVERVRTSSRMFQRLLDYARSCADSGADAWSAQHINAPDQCAELVERCTEIYGHGPTIVSEIGPVLSAHTGPGLLGTGAVPSRFVD